MTRSGVVVAVLALVALVVGQALGWLEFVAFAAAGLVALAVAVPFVIGRLTFDVERDETAERVEVGSVATSTVRLTKRNARNVFGATALVHDRVVHQRSGSVTEDRVPISVSAGDPTHKTAIPTAARGLVTVGPVEVTKADPLGLLRRSATEGETHKVWVHPRVGAIGAMPVGFARDLEGPTTDSSPAGDVAFHAIREYQFGDDHRHIHWMSSARSGSLMVRHYVDNRRPHLLVHVDDDAGVFEPEAYELAVEVAATLAVNGLRHGEATSLANGSEALLSAAAPRSANSLLEDLSLIDTSKSPSTIDDAVSASLRTEPSTSVVAVVTGDRPTASLLSLVDRCDGRSVIIVRCRVGARAGTTTLPGATLLDVDSLRRFQVAWNRAFT